MYAATSLLVASAGLPAVMAWGSLANQAIAYVATNLVEDSTATFYQDLLGSTSATDYLAEVSDWSDEWTTTDKGAFSQPLHFIYAYDNPPGVCEVVMPDDCGEDGCLVTGLSNYTRRAITASASNDDRALATKMVIGLVSDFGAPLHSEGVYDGGSRLNVTFDGTNTTLLEAWDTVIPNAIVGGETSDDAKAWAEFLTEAIKTGAYKDLAASWVDGLTSLTNRGVEAVGLKWAQDSNWQVCNIVLARGFDYIRNNDLSGDLYMSKATPTVHLQVAKSGYRLAKLLDMMAARG